MDRLGAGQGQPASTTSTPSRRECFNRRPTCPTGQLAIVLDGRVVSAPNINAESFQADAISISGSFDEGEAKDLALVLRYGSLPVELEAQQTQSVSASLGKDALDAGVTAGIIGLALVFLYMVIYYRLLGFVAILSLLISASLLWTIIAYLGENQGLALTLAGVTGIMVSIGVAVDSNVVFYEHLKEDVARGRSLRTAVDGSFASAFSTIVKADIASLIGAAILYFLTVGPVRGFALYLGMSTMLDLVASYFFMRPLAVMLVKSKRLQDRPRLFGMPRPKGVTAPPRERSREEQAGQLRERHRLPPHLAGRHRHLGGRGARQHRRPVRDADSTSASTSRVARPGRSLAPGVSVSDTRSALERYRSRGSEDPDHR